MVKPMLKRRLNRYTCNRCRGSIITLDLDEGVTPMFLACRVSGEPRDDRNPVREAFLAKRAGKPVPASQCRGTMSSSMYRGVPDDAVPTHEWFKPTDLSGYSPEMVDHIERGGLDIRPVTP